MTTSQTEPVAVATDLLTDPRHVRRDLNTIAMAVKQGWLIPDELMESLPRDMASIASKGKDRDKVAAAKVVLAMIEQNRKAEPQPVKQVEHHHVHDLGPVTAENLAEHKRRLLEELDQRSRNARRLPGRA